MSYRHFFHPTILAFREELTKHPDLYKSIEKNAHTFEEALAMTATYLNILVDGSYNMIDLLDMLHRQLQKKRMPIFFSQPASEKLKAISSILGPAGKPILAQPAGDNPHEDKEVTYDLQKVLKLEVPDGKEKKN